MTKLEPTNLPAQPEGLGLDDDGWALVCAVKEALKVNLKMPFIHLRHPTVPANPYDNVFGVGCYCLWYRPGRPFLSAVGQRCFPFSLSLCRAVGVDARMS